VDAIKPPEVNVEIAPPRAKQADQPKLPEVLGLARQNSRDGGIGKRESHKDGGPNILIWVNGELYVDTHLRDDSEVSADLLGTYLTRIVFSNTQKVTIHADADNPSKARLKAKFQLRLRDAPKNSDVLAITFDEMRFSKAVSDPNAWALTPEGIELIEKRIPPKKDET
jgi:hypothetical protein